MKQDKQYKGRIQWSELIKKLSPYTIQKGFRYLKHYGPKEFFVRLHERFEPEEIPYGIWYEAYKPTEKELQKQRETKFSYTPLFSIIVPVYKTNETYLRQMITSLQEQTYPNWELCIANGSKEDQTVKKVLEEYVKKDARVRYIDLEKNSGISNNTNAALNLAEGDFTGLLDHDDLLAPDALYEVCKVLNEDRNTDVIYSDEDKVTSDLSEHFQPHFKPDFNWDLLRSNNYICHFFVARTSVLKNLGGFDSSFDGAQDYDLIFRCVENAEKIVHIPKILYHWRTHRESTADNPASKMYAYDAGKRAIEANLSRMQLEGEAVHTRDFGFYRVTYKVKQNPLVSIVIPNKDETETLKNCLDSIRQKTSYQNYEILIVENNSESPEIFRYYKELSKEPEIRLLRYRHPFNYSAINNFAVKKAKGEYVIFLNNDIEIITENWIEEMLGFCQRQDTGIVGAKLLYPDNTIQHAGVVVGMGGIAGSMFVGMPASRTGYLHKASLIQDMSAVTAACMMVKKDLFEEVGGFSEELAVAFNDIDLCLKIRKKDKLVVYDPYVVHYHLESKTRGPEDNEEKIRRFQREIEYMRTNWDDILKHGDPYYNRNLSLTKWNYSLKPIPGMKYNTEVEHA